MMITNSKKSSDGVSFFLIFFTIILLFIGLQLIFELSIEDYDFPFILLLLLFFVCPSLFFIDIIIWRLFGKEIIYLNEEYIIIKKVNRLLKKRKKLIYIQFVCLRLLIDQNMVFSNKAWNFGIFPIKGLYILNTLNILISILVKIFFLKTFYLLKNLLKIIIIIFNNNP